MKTLGRNAATTVLRQTWPREVVEGGRPQLLKPNDFKTDVPTLEGLAVVWTHVLSESLHAMLTKLGFPSRDDLVQAWGSKAAYRLLEYMKD